MLLVRDGKVYRITPEDGLPLMDEVRDETDIHENIGDILMSLQEEIIEDAISTREIDIRVMKAKKSNPDLIRLYHSMYLELWDRFVAANDGDVSGHLVTDITPDQVVYHVHDEFGQGYDLDKGEILDCQNCCQRADEFIAWADRVRATMDREDDLPEDELMELIHSNPDFPNMTNVRVVKIDDDGTMTELKLKPPASEEFDPELPSPTHQGPGRGSRHLN